MAYANTGTVLYAIQNVETKEFIPHSASYGMPALYSTHGIAKAAQNKRRYKEPKYKIVKVKIVEVE